MYPWYVYARINATSNDSMSMAASIILQDKAAIGDDGTVTFENLGVSMAMSDFSFEYYLDHPVGVNAYVIHHIDTEILFFIPFYLILNDFKNYNFHFHFPFPFHFEQIKI